MTVFEYGQNHHNDGQNQGILEKGGREKLTGGCTKSL